LAAISRPERQWWPCSRSHGSQSVHQQCPVDRGDGVVAGPSEEASWLGTLPPGSWCQAPRQPPLPQHPTDGDWRPELVKFPTAADAQRYPQSTEMYEEREEIGEVNAGWGG
jgi:hypothetical protein